MRSVGVFCGSNPGRRPEYLAGAADLGRTLASRGIRVVYGGARVGVMGALADAVLAAPGVHAYVSLGEDGRDRQREHHRACCRQQ